MNYTHKLVFHFKALLIAIAFPAFCLAQKTVRGTVKDEKEAPVSFANVALKRAADSSLAQTAVTSAEGAFVHKDVPAGRYFIEITAIGFRKEISSAFDLSEAAGDIDRGIIQLKFDSKQADNVTVTTLRPTITMEADKMVVGIEGTALASGNSAYSILSRAPGVFIDQDGNIQLNGRSGVLVMLNGKQTYLSARDLRNLLEGMSADNIKNIEVITNPSSKYDAEGTAGILNINLKKNIQQGLNGNISLGINVNPPQVGHANGATVNFKKGRWNSFAILDVNRRVGGRKATFTRFFDGPSNDVFFDQVATGQFENNSQSIRMGTDYELDQKRSIGMLFNHSRSKGGGEFLTDTYIGNTPKNPYQYINADNFDRGKYRNYTGNLHYVEKLDTLGSTFSTDLDYVKITNLNQSNFYNYYTDVSANTTTTDFLQTYIPSGYDIYAAKADLVKSLARGRRMELGVKASKVISDNDSRFFFNNGSVVPDLSRTNHFNYREAIYAGYANFNAPLGKRWSMQSGLRVENTVSRGVSYTTGEVTDRNYVNLFPSLFLQQKVSDNYGITYSYSRRLTRPGYGRLNPFRFYRDPYTWEQGNPNLTPQYTHALTVTQSIMKQYFLTINLMLHKDVMAEIPILDAARATTIYTTGNVDEGYYAGATAVIPFRIMKKWESQNTLSVSYNKLEMTVGNLQVLNDRLSYFFQSNQTILLPKNFKVELTGWYRAPSASGLYQIDKMWRVDLGLRKTFLDKKLELSLNGTDLFKGQQFRFATRIGNNISDFDQYLRFRTFALGLRYNFSRGQNVDSKRRNNNLEEVNRT
jgi:hypothetical protein